MENVPKLAVIWLGAALAGAACAKGTIGGETEGSGAASSESTSSAATGAGGSTGSMSSAASMTGSSSGSGSAATSGSGSSSGSASGGAACTPIGDLSVMGGVGPCAANQNCPITIFTAVVANAPGPIVDVDVSLEAIAASTDQNVLKLRSPQGTLVTLFNHRGNFLTDDFFGTMFDDEAAQAVAMAPGPFNGCFKPEQPLSTFKGESAIGTWKLEVQTCLYQTTVNSWTLHLDF